MRAILSAMSVMVLSGWLGAAAQILPKPPRALSLDEAIQLGLSRNPAFAASWAAAEAARADAEAAQGERWPRLIAEAGARRSDNPVVVFGDKLTAGEFTAGDFALDSLNNPDPINHLSAALVLEAPLYTGGRTRWEIEASRRNAGAEQALLRAAESELAARITEAYFGVTLARTAVEVAEAALTNAAAHESVARARVEAGAALKSDQLRTKVYRLARETELDRRRADSALAASRLGRLVGLEAGETIDPVTPLQEPAGPIGTLEDWIARGAGAPAIEAGREAAGAAEAGAQAARSEQGLEVTGAARYELNAEDFSSGAGSYLVGLSLRWGALDRRRASRIASAESRRLAAESSSRAAEDQVRLAVEQAFHEAGTATRSVPAAREAVAAADAARAIAAARYAEGLLPLTDLLDMETELMNARLGEVTALYMTIVGRTRLAHAAGSLEVPR